jgi:hypothetical protein
MSTLALALLTILAVATATFFVAGGIPGSSWARDVCSLSQALCDHPGRLAVATGVVAVVYFVLRSMRL